MSYCPGCGTEYRAGFTECADCHLPLEATPPPFSPQNPSSGQAAAHWLSRLGPDWPLPRLRNLLIAWMVAIGAAALINIAFALLLSPLSAQMQTTGGSEYWYGPGAWFFATLQFVTTLYRSDLLEGIVVYSQNEQQNPQWPVVFLVQLLGLPWVAARILMPYFVARAFSPPASLEAEATSSNYMLWRLLVRRLSPFVFLALGVGLLLSLTSLIGQLVILNLINRDTVGDPQFRVFNWLSVVTFLAIGPSFFLRMLALASLATLCRTFQIAVRAVYFLEFGAFPLCALALMYAFPQTTSPLYLFPSLRLPPLLLFLAILLPLASRAIQQRRAT